MKSRLVALAIVCAAIGKASAAFDLEDVPSSWDWRDHGCVSPVRNAGQCDDASVFASVAAVESCHCVSTGQSVDLSHQQIVDCMKVGGCNGNAVSPVQVLKYIEKNGGIDSQACYPDTGQQGPCQYKQSCCASTVSNFTLVRPGNEEDLKAAVFQGPVAALVNAQPWETYTSGIFDEPCPPTLDDAVLVVGYGNQSGVPYWIIQNSWGTDWGMEGYLLLRRNHGNLCGIASAAALPGGCGNC